MSPLGRILSLTSKRLKHVTEEDKINSLKAGIEYAGEFQALLRDAAANALHPDPVIAGAELFSLYSPVEVIAGISAAEDVGFTVKEGVACFVLLCAAVHAELQKRQGFFSRLKMKFPPKPGTREHNHIAMTNYVLNTLTSDNRPSPRVGQILCGTIQRSSTGVTNFANPREHCRGHVVAG
jgi:hypothetical protein